MCSKRSFPSVPALQIPPVSPARSGTRCCQREELEGFTTVRTINRRSSSRATSVGHGGPSVSIPEGTLLLGLVTAGSQRVCHGNSPGKGECPGHAGLRGECHPVPTAAASAPPPAGEDTLLLREYWERMLEWLGGPLFAFWISIPQVKAGLFHASQTLEPNLTVGMRWICHSPGALPRDGPDPVGSSPKGWTWPVLDPLPRDGPVPIGCSAKGWICWMLCQGMDLLTPSALQGMGQKDGSTPAVCSAQGLGPRTLHTHTREGHPSPLHHPSLDQPHRWIPPWPCTCLSELFEVAGADGSQELVP